MCLDKHYLGMSNPDLYLPSSVKKISTSSTYSVSILALCKVFCHLFLVCILMQNLETEERWEESKGTWTYELLGGRR